MPLSDQLNKRRRAPMSIRERGEVSTASDCDVILVVKCFWKIHIGETGHV